MIGIGWKVLIAFGVVVMAFGVYWAYQSVTAVQRLILASAPRGGRRRAGSADRRR